MQSRERAELTRQNRAAWSPHAKSYAFDRKELCSVG